MAGGYPNLPTQRCSDPEHRLAPIVDEGGGAGGHHHPVIGEGCDVDGPAARPALVHLGDRGDRSGNGVEDGGIPGDAFTHSGPGPDDVESGGLKPGQQLVEIGVARGETGDRFPPLEQRLQVVKGAAQQFVQRSDGVGHPFVGDLEHHRLGLVDRLGHIVGQAVADLGDVAGDADETAQQARSPPRCGHSARRWRSPA